jgi:hypothetical protein
MALDMLILRNTNFSFKIMEERHILEFAKEKDKYFIAVEPIGC